VLAPALMLICMLILQFGLWFNARQTALAAAQAGAVVARQEAASQPAVSVFPFFGLHLGVSATAGGPVECFRPASQNGAC